MFCFVCIVVGIVGVHVDRFASVLGCRLTSLSLGQIVRLYVYLFRYLLLLFGLVCHQIGIDGRNTVQVLATRNSCLYILVTFNCFFFVRFVDEFLYVLREHTQPFIF